MPISESQRKAVRKYNDANYDRIELKVPKGKKDAIKAHAKAHQPQQGEFGKLGYSPEGSLQGFINRAIDEAMARDARAQVTAP